MPKYAIVTIVQAPRPEEAWENTMRLLLRADGDAVIYVGAPWLVPGEVDGDPIEFETEVIQLRLNGRQVSLQPAD